MLERFSAFAEAGGGGNPAGVWTGEALPDPVEMQRIAAEVGFSETAFAAPSAGFTRTVRYFSPEAEVAFCGHATIALGVALGSSHGVGTYRLLTAVGEVPVVVRRHEGRLEAALMSVEPHHEPAPEGLLTAVLATLGWHRNELDAAIPPVRAYAGVWHLVIAVARRERLATLDYDFAALKALMLAEGLTTLQLIWREGPELYHARDPFPVGGVVEDPATGAAAAARGGSQRAGRRGTPPVPLTL
ncbi:MAG: PhzF family phenazine biosynthesis isomerase, partial [Gemmatimonadota bacterium]|nr:PhzF family phenazine biosynthesis isomerase [Gemmatimonadota bacterium]